MNRLFTILAFSLAVPAFLVIFTRNTSVLFLSFTISFGVACLLFWLESIFHRKGSHLLNRLAFSFQKARLGCIVEEQKYFYERIDESNWQFTKQYQIKSKSNTLDHFNDRFCWSSDSSKASITPCQADQKIASIHSEEFWTVYTVRFNTILIGKSITTGAVISNLVDEGGSARPFLSATVLPKTKLLRMTVKIPKKYKPKNPVLEIHTSSALDSCISRQSLVYNDNTQEIEIEPVRYPRTNWRYVIIWEYDI